MRVHVCVRAMSQLSQALLLLCLYTNVRMQHLCCLVSAPPLSTAWSIRSRPFAASITPHSSTVLVLAGLLLTEEPVRFCLT